MSDIYYILLTLVFLALSWGFVIVCDWLREGRS